MGPLRLGLVCWYLMPNHSGKFEYEGVASSAALSSYRGPAPVNQLDSGVCEYEDLGSRKV